MCRNGRSDSLVMSVPVESTDGAATKSSSVKSFSRIQSIVVGALLIIIGFISFLMFLMGLSSDWHNVLFYLAISMILVSILLLLKKMVTFVWLRGTVIERRSLACRVPCLALHL